MPAIWHTGNAADEGHRNRGWILGHFMDPACGVRSSQDVEVKWGVHAAGEQRAAWTCGDNRTTLALLVEGHFRIHLTTDYLLWGPGIDHSWEALADSVIITVRWPSQP
ncbi:hypothetical protein [Allokutzneria albata]|uniref:Signal peptidase I n=1 Tax=Allokutzneria albata TaxID=211114 RepID=A0A1G9S8N7_ALLAB|nr:hypothetical protein [Allokutzneria albata]SDM31700.1 hypothetical protein SAMN04489726_0961 [Allokutzneria albata]